MANFITKLLRGFSVATQEDIQKDIIAQDKATLAGVPSTKGTGNATHSEEHASSRRRPW